MASRLISFRKVQSSSNRIIFGAVAATAAGFVSSNLSMKSKTKEKYYTEEEIRQFDGTDGKPMYVTFNGAVYDVSEFQKIHPGGKYIKQAAGSKVEPFWEKWQYHYHSQKVKNYLQELRIGYIIDMYPNETKSKIKVKDTANDLYSVDPSRTDEHTVLLEKPFCSETKPEVLKQNYLTPASALYVRNHAPVPNELDINEHEIVFSKEVDDDDDNEEITSVLSIQDILKKYESVNIVSIMQCAGNRAAEDIKATGKTGFVGTPFEFIEGGMVGNVQWSGVLLKNVLKDMFPTECDDKSNTWHVIFEGADDYETSTPLSHILGEENDCLLATKMNGENISPDHGYPIRVILPGIAGARNVKWLQSIKVSKKASNSPWNAYYYKEQDGSHIQKLPINSIVLSPRNGEEVERNEDGCISVEGIAYGGGTGNKITKVEVSVDNGKTWQTAKLLLDEVIENASKSSFGWVRFQLDNVKISSSYSPTSQVGGTTIMCRATDESGITQPKVSPKQRGYLYNGYNEIIITSI